MEKNFTIVGQSDESVALADEQLHDVAVRRLAASLRWTRRAARDRGRRAVAGALALSGHTYQRGSDRRR